MPSRRVASLALAGVLAAACQGAPAPCPPRARPLRVDASPLQAATLLGDLVSRAREAGAEEFVPLAALLASEGEQVGRFVEVPAERCLAVLSRATEGLRDVDLFVFDDAGVSLASDESPQSSAALVVCLPRPGRVYVTAKVAAGTGLLGVGATLVPVAQADAVARAIDARGRPGEDTGRFAAWPGLETRLRERRAALGSSWEDWRRTIVPLDPRAVSVVSAKLEADRCLDVLAVAADDVASLSLDVLDREGRILVHGRATGGEQTALVCSRVDDEVTVALRPRGPRGIAAVVVSRSPRGALAELALQPEVHGPTALRPLEAAVDAHRAGLAALDAGAPRILATGTARSGAASALDVALVPGCARLDVVAGMPLGRHRTELWSASGERLASALGGATSTLFVCAREPERARLEVTALDEPGPFSVALRQFPRAPAFDASPRAAARLLARLEAEHAPVDLRALEGAELRTFEASREVVAPRSPERGCTRYLVATEGLTAIELFLERADGGALGAGQGRGLASVEACVDGGIETRLRVRVAESGPGYLLRRGVGPLPPVAVTSGGSP